MKRVLLSTVMVSLLGASCGIGKTARLAGPAPTPVPADRPVLAANEIAVTWLGVAGALVRGRHATVAFDPYVSRRNLATSLFGTLRPDTKAIDRYIPKVDLVVIGHAHEDHILDAPYLVQRDGADLVGSLTAANVARGYGAPVDKLHVVGPGEFVNIRGVGVTAERAGHVTLLGKVPGSGSVTSAKPGPYRGAEFKTGGARFWRVMVDGIRIGHLSSGKLAREDLPPGMDVDVLLMSTAQMKPADKVVERLLAATHPTFVVPIHNDLFFLDLEADPRPAPGSDRFNEEAFTKQVAELWPAAHVLVMAPMKEQVLNVKDGTVR